MKFFRPRVCAVLTFGLLLFACSKEEKTPVADVMQEAEAAPPPEEKVTLAEAPAPQKDADFLRMEPGVAAATEPAPAPVGDEKAAYEAWFKKYRLDLTDPKMLEADADGDGVSNRDEFLADTDPTDADSRPGIHKTIRLKEYSEVRLPLMLEGVEDGKARIKRTELGDHREETLKVGDTVRGLPLKVERVESRMATDKSGQPVDLSRVTFEDTTTKEKVVLMKDLPTKTSASFAVLASTDGKTVLKVRRGDVFTWPEEPGTNYRVTDFSRDQVVLEDIEKKKTWTIPRL